MDSPGPLWHRDTCSGVLRVMWQSDDLTVEHGEPLQVLVGLQLLRGTQRHTQSHGFDFPLDDVDVAGIQEEDKPAGDRKLRKLLKVSGETGKQLNSSSAVSRWFTVEPSRWSFLQIKSVQLSQSFKVIIQTTFVRLKIIKLTSNKKLHLLFSSESLHVGTRHL